MHNLTLLIKELEDQLVVCIRCGMCQSVCPLFEQTRKEADVARGKLALLNGLIFKLFSNPDGVSNRLNKCLLCGSCAANCPSGVNILEIFIKARAILAEYKGLSPVKKIMFKQVLSKPHIFNTLLIWAEKFQKLAIKSKKTPQGTSCARFSTPFLKHRNFVPVAKKPFHKLLDTMDLDSKRSNYRVAFFTGCLIDKIMPQIAESSIKALHHNNVSIFIPENQSCCGIPALAAGDRDTFNLLIENNASLFRKQQFDFLLTACATCTSTIKKMWPSLYQGNKKNIKANIDDLSERTMDINQFFVDILNVNHEVDVDKNKYKAVTYHDPCHLKKSLGISKQPRQLITASGHELHEMNNADKCCGMGGSFNLTHYDISTQIGDLKGKSIVATNCPTVASACPACIIQIKDILTKKGSNITVKHPIELYADSLKES